MELICMNEQLEQQRCPAKFIFYPSEVNRIPAHWHTNLELNFLVEGEMNILLNGQERLFRPQNVFFVNQGDVHLMKTKNPANTLGLTVVFAKRLIEEIAPNIQNLRFDWSLCPEQHQALRDEVYPIYLLCKKRYEQGLPTDFESEDSFEYLNVLGHMYRILYLMMRYFCTEQSPEDYLALQISNQRVRQAADFIEANYYRDISAKTVADSINVSREYFSRLFRQYTGATFSEYLNSFRLSIAFRALVTTKDSVLDIALDSGFPDVRALNRHFKKRFGMTPGEYRRNMSEGKDITK